MKIQGVPLGNFHTPCPYLGDRRFTSENMMVADVDEEGLDHLLSLGFRHFGTHFFRPVCETCHQCIPLRVPVDSFIFTRNMRRAMRKAGELSTSVALPEVSEEKYRLYRAHMGRFSGHEASGYEGFRESFFSDSPFGRELRIFEGPRLLAVSHFDLTSTVLSAVYCYWDPEKEHFGLGTLAILRELEFAGRMGLRYVYLGYYVPGSGHMNYKARFRPNEILLKEGLWVPLYGPEGELLNPEAPKRGFIPVARIVTETDEL